MLFKQGEPLVDALSPVQEAVRRTETIVYAQSWTLRELLPDWP